MLISCGIQVRSKVNYYHSCTNRFIYLRKQKEVSWRHLVMEMLCQMVRFTTENKASGISTCGKMKAQSCDFTESGSFPNNVEKIMIAK